MGEITRYGDPLSNTPYNWRLHLFKSSLPRDIQKPGGNEVGPEDKDARIPQWSLPPTSPFPSPAW